MQNCTWERMAGFFVGLSDFFSKYSDNQFFCKKQSHRFFLVFLKSKFHILGPNLRQVSASKEGEKWGVNILGWVPFFTS